MPSAGDSWLTPPARLRAPGLIRTRRERSRRWTRSTARWPRGPSPTSVPGRRAGSGGSRCSSAARRRDPARLTERGATCVRLLRSLLLLQQGQDALAGDLAGDEDVIGAGAEQVLRVGLLLARHHDGGLGGQAAQGGDEPARADALEERVGDRGDDDARLLHAEVLEGVG